MNRAAEYRGIAAKFRREAESTTLPQRKKVVLETAERWDWLAEELEKDVSKFSGQHSTFVF
jgi:hypothetical protein